MVELEAWLANSLAILSTQCTVRNGSILGELPVEDCDFKGRGAFDTLPGVLTAWGQRDKYCHRLFLWYASCCPDPRLIPAPQDPRTRRFPVWKRRKSGNPPTCPMWCTFNKRFSNPLSAFGPAASDARLFRIALATISRFEFTSSFRHTFAIVNTPTDAYTLHH